MSRICCIVMFMVSFALSAQPTLTEKWVTLPFFKEVAAFKDIAKVEGNWWLVGEGNNGPTAKDVVIAKLNASTLQPEGPPNWLRLPGEQSVHAIFPYRGCWLAGKRGAPDSRNKAGAWLAHISIDEKILLDTVFEADKSGEFLDILVADSVVIAVGSLDGQLAVAVSDKGAARLFRLSQDGSTTQGRAIAQSAGGDIIIAGESRGKKGNPSLTVWHFTPTTGRFRKIFDRPAASAHAACTEFDGGVAIAGISYDSPFKAGLLLISLKKWNNFPTDSIWAANESVLASDNPSLRIHNVMQMPDSNLIITGGSSNYHPAANCTVFFMAIYNGAWEKPMVRYFADKSGGVAMSTARMGKQGLLLAGASGCSGKGEGKLLQLKYEKKNTGRLPFSGLALPAVVMEDSLSLREQVYDPTANLQVDQLYLHINGHGARVPFRGEKISFESPYSLENCVVKDEFQLYRISGNVPLRRGTFDTLQLKGSIAGTAYESRIKWVYGAPVLHLVAIGNNYDKVSPLRYASDDARWICGFFQRQTGISFRDVNIDLLDHEAVINKDKVRAVLELVAARQFAPGDVFVFFISSHCGIVDGRLKFPYRRPGKYEEYYIDFESDIFDIIKNLPCRKFIFLDACQSGEGIANDLSTIPSEPDVLMVTSCELGEKSFEHEVWKHGAFTYELKAALEGAAVASLHGSFITPADVFRYLEQNTPVRVNSVLPRVVQKPAKYGGENLLGSAFIFVPKKHDQ